MWLPLDCKLSQCREQRRRIGSTSEVPPPSIGLSGERCRSGSKRDGASNWTLVQAASSVLGHSCETYRSPLDWCAHSINVDWWWAGDAALADAFHDTFDRFDHYTQLVRPNCTLDRTWLHPLKCPRRLKCSHHFSAMLAHMQFHEQFCEYPLRPPPSPSTFPFPTSLPPAV